MATRITDLVINLAFDDPAAVAVNAGAPPGPPGQGGAPAPGGPPVGDVVAVLQCGPGDVQPSKIVIPNGTTAPRTAARLVGALPLTDEVRAALIDEITAVLNSLQAPAN